MLAQSPWVKYRAQANLPGQAYLGEFKAFFLSERKLLCAVVMYVVWENSPPETDSVANKVHLRVLLTNDGLA
jgi:hypothetical protein